MLPSAHQRACRRLRAHGARKDRRAPDCTGADRPVHRRHHHPPKSGEVRQPDRRAADAGPQGVRPGHSRAGGPDPDHQVEAPTAHDIEGGERFRRPGRGIHRQDRESRREANPFGGGAAKVNVVCISEIVESDPLPYGQRMERTLIDCLTPGTQQSLIDPTRHGGEGHRETHCGSGVEVAGDGNRRTDHRHGNAIPNTRPPVKISSSSRPGTRPSVQDCRAG